jgi:hypothetical protein
VALCPAVMLAGVAESETVGAGAALVTVTVADAGSEVPPLPEHVMV